MGHVGITKWDYSEVNDKYRLGVFIGESKKNKYLLKFGMRIYDDSCINLPRRAKLSWNWSALFGGVLWMGYRKMYIELAVLSTLFMLPNLIFSNISDTQDTLMTALYWLVLGLLANSLYFAKCKREITRIKKLNLSLYDELEVLKHKGGTSVAGIFISILILIIEIAIYAIAHLYLI
ncbi:DUF2628 domain-containing protein [Bacillus sp. B-jedd]|uniref:DUF2628 domain-containing protein n=1 Tax=Bacillus sp. B-jedd TaxID=1476857 RepID=UPI0005156ECA|nr:DUF2628 domain-containing protein [Bacillus sp. B-jedd]CEG26257.1 hypothetical protein BN1002_01099 [Bacillus sp. B-jedd]